MSQKHYAPLFKTFAWLRQHEAIDTNCERVLRMVSKRYKKVLVCGNPASGKNTVANAIFDATGKRLRTVPFTPERVRAALIQPMMSDTMSLRNGP